MAFVKYQYKLLKNVPESQITEANLNMFGQEGWKLIHIQLRDNGNYDGILIRE